MASRLLLVLLLAARLAHGACSTLSHGVMQPSHGLSPWDAGCADVNWGLLNTLNGGYSTIWNSFECLACKTAASPSPIDDDFNDNVVDAKWLQLNAGSTTFSEENFMDHKMVTNTGDATANIRGEYQAAPGSLPWTVSARITGPISNNNTQFCGLFVRNSNASNKHIEFLGPAFVTANGFNVIGDKFSDVGSFFATFYQPAPYTPIPTSIEYFRVTVDSTNITWLISQDGLAWFPAFQETKATFMEQTAGTIDQVGIMAEDSSASVATTCYFYWFRFGT